MEEQKNKDYSNANCMGFALRHNSWLVPGNWLHYEDYIQEVSYKEQREELTFHEFLEERLDLVTKELVSAFNIRVVSREDMEIGKNYIAYREAEADFHFMYRLSSGKWMHKMGSCIVKSISEDEVFSNEWYNGWYSYDSKIILFEVLNKS